jgi:hypothetical protein
VVRTGAAPNLGRQRDLRSDAEKNKAIRRFRGFPQIKKEFNEYLVFNLRKSAKSEDDLFSGSG